MIQPLRWHGNRLDILDQRLLPDREAWLPCYDEKAVAEAICYMAIRGAPAIGVAAAFGVVLAAQKLAAAGQDKDAGNSTLTATAGLDDGVNEVARKALPRLKAAFHLLRTTRPTAVNLFWALDRMEAAAESFLNDDDLALGLDAGAIVKSLAKRLADEAITIKKEDIDANLAMGDLGSNFLTGINTVYTHCNTGGLATAGHGTALGIIKSLWKKHTQPASFHVYAGETRPYLQGARLTAWELKKEQVPFSLVVDAAAGYLMAEGLVEAVITGADRVVANGDVANKIGTYTLALLARQHDIPFFVAAPFSTIDLSLADGKEIAIEERPAEEVSRMVGVPIAPTDTNIFNPAFDITPGPLITAIITDVGVAKPPYERSLQELQLRREAGAQHA